MRSTRPARKQTAKAARYPDLKTYIAESGDTQQHIAQRVGTSQAHMSRIVAGRVVPRPLLAVRLAKYAGVPLESFLRARLAHEGGGDA
jgi:transcriptional regulator with XRE-family HTH domain